MIRKIIIAVVILLLLCLAIIALPIVGALFGTQPVAAAGDAFMAALRDGNYTQAFSLCSSDFQDELGGPQGIEARIMNGNTQPVSWNFNNRQVEGTDGTLSGSAVFTGNREGMVRLTLKNEAGQWRIFDFEFPG